MNNTVQEINKSVQKGIKECLWGLLAGNETYKITAPTMRRVVDWIKRNFRSRTAEFVYPVIFFPRSALVNVSGSGQVKRLPLWFAKLSSRA